MRNKLAVALLAWTLCGLTGCASSSQESASNREKSARESIDAIELYMMPTVLNWDNVPGPDGVQARIILFSAAQPEPVTLTQGTIEFVLYEGKLSINEIVAAQTAQNKPFFVWSFTPAQIAGVLEKSVIGYGYSLQLGWGKKVPAPGFITLVTRHLQPQGQMVYSAPVILPMPKNE